MVVVVEGPAVGGFVHSLVDGPVWQIVSISGRPLPLSSTVAVIVPGAAMLIAAAVKKPVPVGPGILTMPVFPSVAPMAIRSGTGVGDDDNSSVLRPGTFTVT